jgi:hypothetical protein
VTIGPAPVLALLVGSLHACLFIVVRGTGGRRSIVLVAAAVLGAWTGDAIAGRLDLDPVRLGDFHLVAASLVAWVGIALVVTMSSLAPAARRGPDEAIGSVRSEVRRREPGVAPSGSAGPDALEPPEEPPTDVGEQHDRDRRDREP